MANPMKFVWDDQTGEFKPVQDEHGHELLDPTPLAIPTGMKRPERLEDQIRRLVRDARFQQALAEAGDETFEDADDFDVGDDFDPTTPYETFFDPVLGKEITPMEFRQREAHYKEQFLKASREYYEQVDREGILQDNLIRARHQAAQSGERGADPRESPKGDAPKPA